MTAPLRPSASSFDALRVGNRSVLYSNCRVVHAKVDLGFPSVTLDERENPTENNTNQQSATINGSSSGAFVRVSPQLIGSCSSPVKAFSILIWPESAC